MKEIGVPGANSEICSIAMSNDKEYVVSLSYDFAVCVWNVSTGRQVGDALHDHEGWVKAIAVSHDCRWFVSASDDMTIRLWELPSGKKQLDHRLLVIQIVYIV